MISKSPLASIVSALWMPFYGLRNQSPLMKTIAMCRFTWNTETQIAGQYQRRLECFALNARNKDVQCHGEF